MIKKFLGLLIVGLGFVGVSFGSWSVSGQIHYIGVAGNLNNDLTTDLLVKTKGNFLTEKGNSTKKVLDFGSNHFMWWGSEGNLYIYETQARQGYANWYRVCPVITENTTMEQLFITDSYCNNGTFSQSYLNDFLNNVGSSDYYALGILSNGGSTPIFNLCISSSIDNATLCFGNYIRRKGFDGTTQGFTIDNSEKISYTFDSLDSSVLYNSPAGLDNSGDSGGDNPGGGGGSGNSGITIQGPDVVLGCFNRDIKSYYERNGLTPNVCYGGINNLLSGNLQIPIAGTGLNYQEIYRGIGGKTGPYNDYFVTTTGNWFNYWRSAYNNLNYVQTSTVFDNYPSVLYTYFNFVSTYGNNYNNNQIMDYCDIIISNDLNSSYTGYNSDFRCKNGVVLVAPGSSNNISGDNQSVIQGAWTGSIIGLLTGSNSSGDVEEVQDFDSFMSNWFDNFKDLYSGIDSQSLGLGFLPWYIVAFMILLIFFRFFSH